MLHSITLKFTDAEPLTLPLDGATIFVGPNNSGKSLLLREVEQAVSTNSITENLQIISSYEVVWQTKSQVTDFLSLIRNDMNDPPPPGHISVASFNANGGMNNLNINEQYLYQILEKQSSKQWYAANYLRFGLLRLDGRSRFNLTNDQPSGDLLKPAINILGKLFRDEAARLKARGFVKDAFGVYLVVDPTNPPQLRLRLSSDAELVDEQSLNEKARSFHKRATYIKDASDGVQAYVGIIAAVTSGNYHTILIDEPEAFLHPPLARRLGRQLASLSKSNCSSLLASTHSADFLMGCIQGGASVRVVRLEYQGGRSKGRLVDQADLQRLFQNPLMRSANAASALFYDGVVVTESDNDRAFYAEIYHRLLEKEPSLPAILFINAQNKQTIRDIIGPLRTFGVPAAAITDIDLIKDGGSDWAQWLNASNVPGLLHDGYHRQRVSIVSAFNATNKNMKKDGGIDVLGHQERLAAEQFFDDLNSYGVFPVRGGEIESWLKDLGVAGQKTKWTIAMLERLGDKVEEGSYVHPTTGDVWDFLRAVITWIANPGRKGTA